MSTPAPTPQELRKQWVDALRSGKYRQGQRRLRIDGGFCCLGVLCDLHPEAGQWKEYGVEVTLASHEFVSHGWRSAANAPPELYAAMQLPFHADYLAMLNDQGYSFEQIANIIEANQPPENS